MKKIKIAINGFGRIGRSVLRALYESDKHQSIQVVAINDIADPASMAHLFQYDSSHGRFFKPVSFSDTQLIIHHEEGQEAIPILNHVNLDSLSWKEYQVDIVLDCTGKYGSLADGEHHIQAGAKKVLFSHPGEPDIDKTIIYGVNHELLTDADRIVSNGSCTTNCIIPIIQALDTQFGIDSGTITTIHSAMNDQQVIDAYHPDLRRSRAASQSIIPVDTKLHLGIARIYPKFKDKFEAISVRVPTINVTAMDLSVTLHKNVKVDDVNQALIAASRYILKGIVDYTEAPLVSTDFNHDSHSAIVDGSQTRVSNHRLVKVLVWCDNEWGFANRMLDTAAVMGRTIKS